MNQLLAALAWLADPAHWAGRDGIATRIAEHAWYSVLAARVMVLSA